MNIRKTIAITVTALVALAGVGYALTMGLAKPIGTDLSDIGQGRPALVLAYENFSPTGGAALNGLRAIKGDYTERLDFRVADLGTPAGRAFAERHGLHDGMAVFLLPDGEPLRVTDVPADEGALRARIDQKLAEAR